MSEADKMFEALGYKKDISCDYNAEIFVKDFARIIFNIDLESIFCEECYESLSLKIGELKAINKKCEELGWINRE